MRRIILFGIICAMLFSQAVSYAAGNSADAELEVLSQSEDRRYDEALSMLCNLNLTVKTDKNPMSTVTREEFAYYLAYMYGVANDITDESEEDSDKYTGYTSEEPVDDWLWEEDKPEQNEQPEIKNTGTPFYDVASDNIYYAGIRFAAQMGFMTGSGGYFRPGERITYAEMIKVMVDMLSAGFAVKDRYPDGYLSLAATMKVTDGLNMRTADSFVTYRDFIVCLRNTLETENYVEEPSVRPAYKKNGKTFMENRFSICSYEGIVRSNALTCIDSSIKASINGIWVGDNLYECDASKYNDYLGYNVTVYYDSDNEDVLLYMAVKYLSNKVLEIDAEDIEVYKTPYLEYESGRKTKKEYLGSQTIIIRNNILLDNYSEADIVPVVGSIKLLDNNRDGDYEIAFIEAKDIILVNVVDAEHKTIYDKISGKSVGVDLSQKDDIIITDINGDALEFEDIKTNAVLEVQDTTEKQDTQTIWIRVLYKTLNGVPSSINTADKTVTIDGKEYKVSPFVENISCRFNTSYTFYMDSKGTIVGWNNGDFGLQNAYLIKTTADDAEERYYARLWEYNQNKFTTYELADKVKFNGVRTPADKVLQSSYIKNSDTGKTTAQVVSYGLNSDNEINELVTQSEFTTLYIGDNSSLQYRVIPGAFMSTMPEFYADQTTPYLKVPTENVTNEELYSIDTPQQDKKYKVTAAYTEKEDSMKASVIIERQQDSAATVTVSSDREPVYIITKIYEEYIYDDIYTAIICENNNGQKKLLVEQKDRFSVVNDYHPGDLIRATYYEKTMKVLTIERLFDCEKMMLDDTSYHWSDAYPNPLKGTNLTDQHYVAGFGLAHGTPLKRFDDGELMQLALYGYSRDDDSNLIIDRSATDNTLTLKTSGFTVYEFDRNRKLLDKRSVDSAVLDKDSAEDRSSEIVAYSVWGEPKIIFMYK